MVDAKFEGSKAGVAQADAVAGMARKALRDATLTAPFDAVMVTAAAAKMPEPLETQLGPGGRMIVPVGTDLQELILVRRVEKGLTRERLLAVRYVPLVKAS
jgi:protein-L-isoaspartate O-methyltransferase